MKEAIFLSLKIALLSTLVVSVFSITIAYIFYVNKFKYRRWLTAFLLLPLAIPPTITGYLLLFLMGNQSFLGKIWQLVFGSSFAFSWWAACLASIIVSFPLMFQSCQIAFSQVDKTLLQAAKIDGANAFQRFYYILLPLSRNGIIAGALLAFLRAMGEFGATLMVAGNIPGKTQTIPLLIYSSLENGDFRSVQVLVFVILMLSFGFVFISNRLIKKQ